MIRLEINETDRDKLQQAKQTHPDPQVRRRMAALHLKALGYQPQQIGQIVGINQKTLRDYLRRYETGGLEALGASPAKADPQAQVDFLKKTDAPPD